MLQLTACRPARHDVLDTVKKYIVLKAGDGILHLLRGCMGDCRADLDKKRAENNSLDFKHIRNVVFWKPRKLASTKTL